MLCYEKIISEIDSTFDKTDIHFLDKDETRFLLDNGYVKDLPDHKSLLPYMDYLLGNNE